jgi:hypothetical protein
MEFCKLDTCSQCVLHITLTDRVQSKDHRYNSTITHIRHAHNGHNGHNTQGSENDSRDLITLVT